MTMNQNKPAHAVTVRTYNEFRDDVNAFAQGKYNFAIVIGGTGIAKTETVKEMLKKENLIEVTGAPTAWGFYKLLHDNQNKYVVLDDVSPRFFKDEKTN